MADETGWGEVDEWCSAHEVEAIGPVIRPNRAIDMSDIDDIFAGRPLKEACEGQRSDPAERRGQGAGSAPKAS